MRRGTTPTIRFKLPFSTADIAAVFVSFEQNDTVVLNKELAHCTCEGNYLSVALSQQDTLALCNCEKVRMQIRVRKNDGSALASNIMETFVDEILKDGTV